jgi:hypothetical protein
LQLDLIGKVDDRIPGMFFKEFAQITFGYKELAGKLAKRKFRAVVPANIEVYRRNQRIANFFSVEA